MDLVEKIKRREMEFDSNELFDLSDTKEIVNNNYNAIVDEIDLLSNEIINMKPIDTGKNFNLTKTIHIYEKYKEELLEICKIFNDSKIDYAERLNLLISLRISYQIRNEFTKIRKEK